jgi:glycosyltransferase involved in cell wall biosynthesis
MISVVTIVFNGENEIEKTILSVLQQSYKDFEFIVVDGGSKDGTVGIIKKYNSGITSWVSEKDNGIYDAMNKGVRMARGEYIIFMNGGDRFYESHTLEMMAETLISELDKIIIYGDAEIVTKNGTYIQYQRERHRDPTKSIVHQSMFVKRSYLLQNPYDVNFSVMADYDNLLKLSIKHPEKLLYVNRTVCIYNKFGVSSKPLYQYFSEYYRIAFKRMPFAKWIYFNLYIFPRLVYSFRSLFSSR